MSECQHEWQPIGELHRCKKCGNTSTYAGILRKERDELKQRIAALREILRKHEYSAKDEDGDKMCPECEYFDPKVTESGILPQWLGHAPDCALQKLLEEEE